jgi:uncharacterized integral membrane protein
MNKNKLIACLILVITALVLVYNTMNGEDIKVDLIFKQIKMIQSLAFLGFIVIGAVIGGLLK